MIWYGYASNYRDGGMVVPYISGAQKLLGAKLILFSITIELHGHDIHETSSINTVKPVRVAPYLNLYS
jgi:hypothetical protein